MGNEIQVQTDALMSLARDYRRYGQSIYSKYRNGSSRIENELSSILSKYSEYSSVTSKVYSIQRQLRETEQYIKKLEEKSNKISTGLTEAAKAYVSSEQEAKEILNRNKRPIDGIETRAVTTRVNISTKVVSQQEKSIGDKIGDLWDGAVDKINDVVEDTTDFVTHFDLSATLSGINKKFQDTVSNMKTDVSDAAVHIQTQVSEFAEKVKGSVINFASGVKDKWEGFTSGVGDFFKKAKDTLADLGEKLLDGMGNIVDRLSEVVRDTIDYMIEHKNEMINGLKKVGVILLDGTQLILDILGLIPGLGEAADALNGVIYLARGDALNAGLSFAACIPFAGWAATIGKMTGKVVKVIDKIGDVSKIVDKVIGVGKILIKHGDDAARFILKKGEHVINFLAKKGDDIWSLISNSKIYNKANEIIGFVSKKGEAFDAFLSKQGEKLGLGMKEWWERQLREGILPSENAAFLNIGVDGAGEVIVGETIKNTVEKEVKEEILEELAEKAFKEIDLKDIEKVVEEGDILKVRFKDGIEVNYKKADLSVDEVKKLEESKFIEGVSKADSIIDGLKVVDGKVAGKIPVEDYKELRKLSIHNKEADSITLGKYRPTINPDGTENWKIPGPDSYNMIAKKDSSMYFDMGSAYDDAMKKYDLSYQEMFDYFNVPALDDAVSTGKTIRFSHNPELPAYKGSFTELEWKYLQEKYDYLYLREEGGIWYAEK